jgi:hypothetical protein
MAGRRGASTRACPSHEGLEAPGASPASGRLGLCDHEAHAGPGRVGAGRTIDVASATDMQRARRHDGTNLKTWRAAAGRRSEQL